MLELALVLSSLAAALVMPADGAYGGCTQLEPGGLRIVEAAFADCTISEPPGRREVARGAAGGVFVVDATGRILGHTAGLLGDRVMWIADGLLFLGSTDDTLDFVLLYLDDDCGGQPYVESAPYANLAMPVQGPTGTREAFVYDGGAQAVAPRSIWTGEACARPCPPLQQCSASFSERRARPVRSIGPYPTYTPPFSLVGK
jgi:hypothetical protein